MTATAVLVLNQNYEPLNVCNARRAFVLVDRGKAEVLENGQGYLRSPSFVFEIPSVIRLVYIIRRPRPRGRLCRRDVFLRDRYTCQYCGRRTRDLTLDHVLPRYRGGEHTWENVVSACTACNRRKAGKTPKEAGMKLSQQPAPPKGGSFFYMPRGHQQIHSQWQKYQPQ